MTTSKDYLSYVLDLLSDVSDVTYRAMMGEYLLYAEGKLFGGIYDERLLVKDVPAARALLAVEAIPYEGAKPRQVLVDRAGWHDIQVKLGMISGDDDMALAAEMNGALDDFDN